MSTISEVYEQLQTALADARKAQEAFETALSKLEPLKIAAEEKKAAVAVLIGQFQGLTGEAPSSGRRGRSGPRKAYNITPQTKIAAAGKRAYTRAKNGGASEKDAKNAMKAAESALSEKLGVK